MRAIGVAALAVALAQLAGCGLFGGSPRKPAPLTAPTGEATLSLAWSANVGKASGQRFVPEVIGAQVFAAAADGAVSVTALDSGQVTRFNVAPKLASGPAGGPDLLFAGTLKGEVIAFTPAGEVRWRANVGGEVIARVVVSGNVAIVRTSDGRVFGLARADGKRLWAYQRTMPPLLLRGESGAVATPTGAILGVPGGRLISLDRDDGRLVWEITVAQPRGATELERITDVVGVPMVEAGRVCAAAFQGKVGCFEIQGGATLWSRDLSSPTGAWLDAAGLYLADDDDAIHALDRDNGASRWKQDKLANRRLTAPVSVGPWLVVGDGFGYVHVLAKETGAIAARHAADGSAVQALVPVPGGVVFQTAGGTLGLLRF